MKAAIYTPYLDTLGGGELYMLSIGRALIEAGWEVHIENKSPDLIANAAARFDIDLSKINSIDSINRGEDYDACFWLSDGSIPLLRSRNNILHFQRPFQKVDGKSLLNRMKFYRIKNVIVNSNFTKSWIDKEYPVKSVVIYPPVNTTKFRPKRKEKIILYIGRFSQLEQNKNQDVLLDVFTKFRKSNPDWKLVLAGGTEVGRTKFVDELKEKSKGKSVEIIESPKFETLKDLFGRASIFWSAAGFGVDEAIEPQKVEHFGITVVEAMSAGMIPIVFNGGGHKEIITHGKDGLLWNTKEGLLKATEVLIQNKKTMQQLALNAKETSEKFDYAHFKTQILSIV